MNLQSVFKYITGIVRIRGTDSTIAEVVDGHIQVQTKYDPNVVTLLQEIRHELKLINKHLEIVTDETTVDLEEK